MNRAVAFGLMFVLLAVTPVSANPVIIVGDHELLPDTPDQQIEIYVSGGDDVQGVNFYVQVADGGPEAVDAGFVIPPGIDGPAITLIDLLTGTIFANDNTGQTLMMEPAIPEWAQGTTTTPVTAWDEPVITVPTDGLLATVTLSTVGFGSVGQSWDLKLRDTLGIEFSPSTDFLSQMGSVLSATITNGSITIAPLVLISTDSGDSEDGATWDGGGNTPTADYAVVVGPHSVGVVSNVEAYSLSINDGGGEVRISAGSSLSTVADVDIAAGTLAIDATGEVQVGNNMAISSGSTLAVEIADAAAGQIIADGDVDLAGTIDFEIDAASPFQAGTYSLITSGGPSGISGTLAEGVGLGSYTTGDGLNYSAGAVTLTIDYDLLPGDADLSTTTDLSDFNIWNANKFTSDTGWRDGDLNGDGITDLSDFNLWNANKFTVVSGGAAPAPMQVPEPGTIAMLVACGLLGLLLAVRRRRLA